MKDNELDGPAFKMKEDPRVTKFGRVLRRTSIDELPQLINILKGEMSFVGPRPLPTYETVDCNERQMRRHLVKPGLTCYWQCMGRNNIPFEEWMELDLRYLEEASLLTDIKIIVKTIGAVIKRDGAYYGLFVLEGRTNLLWIQLLTEALMQYIWMKRLIIQNYKQEKL